MLRDATEADLDDMLRWRNHEQARAVSLTSHVIGPEEHRAWWARVSTDPTRRVLVHERDGVPSGVVNFFDHDPAAGTVEWGFYLDADGLEERGETLSAWMDVQREALDYAFGVLDVEVLLGEVLEHNTAVRRMNKRFGFVEGEPELREVGGRQVNVYPLRLRREDRRGRSRQEQHA